jgi:hypothetical protein
MVRRFTLAASARNKSWAGLLTLITLRAAVGLGLMVGAAARSQVTDIVEKEAALMLPDAPSTLLTQAADGQVGSALGKQDADKQQETPATQTPATKTPAVQTAARQAAADQRASVSLPPCENSGLMGKILWMPGNTHDPCDEMGQLEAIVDAGNVKPMTRADKEELTIRSILDPFNLLTITAFSGISIAANSHSAYGPGLKGFARLTGYSFAGDVQGEVIGTYVIPVLTHEDPRYHRMSHGPIPRRALHAVVHTYVTQHDNGSLMPNYSVLAGYPIGNVLSNLYVPGLATNGQATARRIAYGIALNPVGDVVAEFLPDVARRIHIHVIFVQQILNKVAPGSQTPQ